MSYNGAIDFGLLGDFDAMEDIDLISEGISESLDELVEAARDAGKAAEQPAGDRVSTS
jgi:hypothetical protein